MNLPRHHRHHGGREPSGNQEEYLQLCIDDSDPNIYILRIFSYIQAGSQVGYKFQVNNIASSVTAITSNYDGDVNIGNC